MYGKLFASLYNGTLRGKTHEILVFTNLLANADQEGFVDKHFKAISDEVGISVDEVKKAIERLESPDPESRSQELEGRRLERIASFRDWGWRIVNYIKYNTMRNEDSRREYMRKYMQQRRASQNVNSVNSCKPLLADIDVDVNIDNTCAKSPPDGYSIEFLDFWERYPKKKSKGDAYKAWRQIHPDAQLVTRILLAVDTQKLWHDWKKDGGQYIPYPATWLRASGWEDEGDSGQNQTKFNAI